MYCSYSYLSIVLQILHNPKTLRPSLFKKQIMRTAAFLSIVYDKYIGIVYDKYPNLTGRQVGCKSEFRQNYFSHKFFVWINYRYHSILVNQQQKETENAFFSSIDASIVLSKRFTVNILWPLYSRGYSTLLHHFFSTSLINCVPKIRNNHCYHVKVDHES